MNLGAEPKKVAILGVLIVAGAVAFYVNMTGDSTSSAPAPRTVSGSAPNATLAVGVSGANGSSGARVRSAGRVATDFRPRVPGTRPDDHVDPASIDPELRLDLLMKVQAVEPIPAGRNLFQFGAAPKPETPVPPLPPSPAPIPINRHPDPPPPVIGASGPQTETKAAPPPISFKYYGYKIMDSDGRKVAFLMDGEEIVRVEENQTVKQRYRIVRIALKSIVIEDIQAKSTQTLQLQDTPG